MSRLANRIALITGAGSGIGAAIARAFVREGAIVIVTDIDGDAAGRTAGETMSALAHDVADEAAWSVVVDHVRRRFGGLDVLVNNAGVASDAALVEMSYAEWRRILSINCDGVFLGMKHAIPVMRDGGSIVNMASVYGKVGGRRHVAYAASKGAVTLMSKAAALECAQEGRGIRVNSLHPGYTQTAMFDRMDDARRRGFAAIHPIGRVGTAEEIAEAALFLASAESSFVTGSELVVDGGFTAQ